MEPLRGDFDILPAPPAQQQAALELVLREVPHERRAAYVGRLMEAARGGRLEMEGLLIAQRGTEVVGAVWAQRQPGRVASVWPAATREPQAIACADALLAEAVTWLGRSDVRVAQALVAPDAEEQAARFERHGFAPMAELLSMMSLAAQFPTSAPRSSLRLESAPGEDDSRLAAVVERTYEGTLDCPRLNGVREVRDVLAGYRACGAFDPAQWFIVCREKRDVGCLLLTDHPDEDQWEIVYAGLVPEERGVGSGLALARHAQWLARQAGRSRLVLAVDAGNVPAVATYTSADFVIWDRRRAFLRIFPNAGDQR
jgi:mycothiol synthase